MEESTTSMPSCASEKRHHPVRKGTYEILGLDTAITLPPCSLESSEAAWKTVGEFRDPTTLLMMSQADVNVSWKRMIFGPLCNNSRQQSSLSAPTSDCWISFHIVVAITTFLISPHRVSNSVVFFCGEPTLRLSEIRCRYTIPAIVETL
jgi:hypothetical protein